MTRRGAPRIGAYGGTFDPIHNGHLEVARAVAARFDLDVLLLIPASCPPHKDAASLSPSHHRYTMAVLASLDIPRVLVSPIEIEQPDRPYTFETVQELRRIYGPDARLYFVIGSDSFEEMHTWRRPSEVLAGANLIVAARPGYQIDLARLSELEAGAAPGFVDCRSAGGPEPAVLERGAGLIFLTDYVSVDASSTEIRKRIAGGMDVNEFVPPAVNQYITKYDLYRPAAGIR